MGTKKRKKAPTIASQSITDRKATSLVEDWLADDWVLYPHVPDYHVDWIVEPADQGELTGFKFCAQQKARRTLVRSKSNTVSIAIKAKHLIYYSQRLHLPVFAFAVDVSNKKGYYLFLQEWIEKNITLQKLEEREQQDGSITIPVPIANLIENTKALLAEVTRGFLFMKKRHPGEVLDAIEFDVKELAKIDPRWKISLDVVDGKKQYSLLPQKEMKLSVSAQGKAAKGLEELYNYGKPLDATGSELRFLGSPLFEIKEIASVKITPSVLPEAEIEISSDGICPFRFSLPVTISRGEAGVMLIGGWNDSPFTMEFKMPKGGPVVGGLREGSIQCRWDFQCWFDKPIGMLAYFPYIYKLSLAIIAKDKIHFDWIYKGNSITKGSFGSPKEEDPFLWAALMVDHIQKIREIVAKTNIGIRINKETWGGADCILRTELVHSLIIQGEYRGDGSQFSREGEISLTGSEGTRPEEILEEFIEHNKRLENFSFTLPNQSAVIYGTPIQLGAVEYTLSHAAICVIESSKAGFLKSETSKLSVQIKGSSGCHVIMKVVQG